MGINDDIEKALNQGAGIEASILGQKVDVYRKNELLFPQTHCYIKRVSNRQHIEAAVSLRNIIMVELTMDGTDLELGDVIQGEAAEDRYVVASMRSMRPILAFRTESQIKIRRPVQPTQTTNPDTGIEPYAGVEAAKNWWLTYNTTTNQYAFQAPTTPNISEAVLYAGKSQINYTGSTTPFKLPTDTRITRWIFVMEILPGLKLQEGDHIIFEDDNYEIYSVDKQVAGFTGQILTCDLVKP